MNRLGLQKSESRKVGDWVGLRHRILSATLSLRAAQIRLLLSLKAYDPEQPRVPRDYRSGGRWIAPGDDYGPPAKGDVRESLRYLLASSDPDDFEDIPEEPPLRPRERATLGQRLAKILMEQQPQIQLATLLARFAWMLDETAHDIIAYLDPPKSLAELREAALNPRKGYDVHHIVEQTPARRDGFDDGRIQGQSNKVLIPRYKHWEINAWYGRPNAAFGGLSPREYLRGRSWEERLQIGLYALRLFGVLTK